MSHDPAYQREYYRENRERIRTKRRLFAIANPERVKAWEANTNRRPPSPAKVKIARQRYERSNPDYILWNSAKQRARKAGLEFSITLADIKIPALCPLLGLSIEHRRGGHGPKDNSPSLDRIDNSRGYVPGNVWVISWRANRIKCDASVRELRLLCANLLKKFRKERP